ncbi:similar to HMG box protein [Plenodomus lingam JN3]|uniref:Similar to HMG box protein n=1 Tax=Leptosphaeria maculans (strain JN3 / isolate v23.1.3 / race Av1-4-5-6-7-8) TaxID=985895 RepID=E4ZN48_LEPMJ|nr:similar to HMG box protein [Plenodomus lingam JN3]CBX92651.1 similar to HMG box protein [Plenodomus lingam JN3]
MQAETLIHQHPPTPPINGIEYQAGLSHIVEYNADGSYSFSEVSHGSPRPMAHETLPSGMPYISGNSRNVPGLSIQYDGYGPATDYLHSGQYNSMQNHQGPTSPPTPRSQEGDDSVQRTVRSGRIVAPVTPPRKNDSTPPPKAQPRVLKTPRTRKPKAGKSDKPKTPELTAPLSILTKELQHIPVKNMEEWVNRPPEVRHLEAQKRNGYITRPMNSFMLYRSAYAERAKSWCLQNNHQVVSSVAGESWPLEPTEIRELYNEYAKIERINHQNAHPTYKFSPSKAVVSVRKRRSEWSDDEPSDLEDAEWAPGSGSSRSRQAKRIERSMSYPHNNVGMIEYMEPRFGPNRHGVNTSTWEMANGGRQVPIPMAQNDLYNQYYQTAAYQQPMYIASEYNDATHMRRVDASPPPVSFASDNSLLGLPGGNSDLLRQFPSHGNTPFDDTQVDPILMGYAGGHSDINPSTLQHSYRPGHLIAVDERLRQQDLDNLLEFGLSNEEFRNGSWQSDPTIATLEQESEFEKWMGGDH